MTIPVIDIDDLLREWAAHDPPLEPFTLSHVIGSLELPASSRDQVWNYLLAERPWKLTMIAVSVCENDHRGELFPIDEIPENLHDECHICGASYVPPAQWPVGFLFTATFVSESKKNSARP